MHCDHSGAHLYQSARRDIDHTIGNDVDIR
jgi:hypothetical protein